jgi:hypothetical protein
MVMWDDLVCSRPSINNYETLIRSLLFVAEYLYKRGSCTLLVKVIKAVEDGNTPDPYTHDECEAFNTRGEEEEEMSLSTTLSLDTNRDDDDETDLSSTDSSSATEHREGHTRMHCTAIKRPKTPAK